MKKVIHALIRKMVSPLTDHFLYHLWLFCILSLPSIVFSLLNGEYSLAVYKVMLYYVLAYFITLFTTLYSAFAKKIQAIVIVPIILHFLLSSFCVKALRCVLSFNLVETIAGTNLTECKEFFYTFVRPLDLILWSLLLLVILFLTIRIINHPVHLKLKCLYLPLSFLLFSIPLLIRNHVMIERELCVGTTWIFRFDEIVDLREHLTHPHVEATDSLHPKQIVVIIGESFARSHSSLYGYERATNPKLSDRELSGNLFVFSDVTSPEVLTTASFKRILTTYCLEQSQNEDYWYNHTNLIEAFRTAGYHTAWVSSQKRSGMYDNLPSGYSRICDEAVFDERNISGKYDDYLIDAYQNDTILSNLIVYHMMGQHPSFSHRYPDGFCQFGPKANKNEEPSKVLIDYDNATLFNDYVVSSIIDNYANQDAMVVYFPDHGLDLFDTDPEYFGHARGSQASIKVSKEIPFMIYLSDYCMARNPALSSKVRALQSLPFCTDNLIYLLLDLSGYHLLE